MTTQDALNWIDGGWRTSRYAKTIPNVGTGIDVDNLYGFQCKDFANGYADYVGNPFGGGNAIALWDVKQAGWRKVSDPQPGDVFVRNYTASDGINYGDTGVVKSVNGSTVRVVQQNLAGNLNVGSPPAERTYNKSIMLGYLRNNSIGEEIVAKPSKAEVKSAAATYDRNLSDSEVDYYANNSWEVLLNALLPAVNADRLQYLKAIGELRQQVEDLKANGSAHYTKEGVLQWIKDN